MPAQELFDQAIEHHRQGRLRKAQELYRQALALEPQRADIAESLAQLMFQLGDLPSATQALQQAVSNAPQVARLYANLGVVLTRQGRSDEAVAAYRQALTIRPDLAEAANNLGHALVNLGRIDEAIDAFRQAEFYHPRQPEIQLNLAGALHQKGREQEAIDCCNKALAMRPEFAAAYNVLGNIHYVGGRLDQSLEAYQNAAKFSPDSAVAVDNHAMVLMDAGRLDETIAVYRDALQRRSDPGLAGNLLYRLHFHPAYDRKRLFEEHTRWRQTYAEPLKSQIGPHTNDRSPQRRLRIGYCTAGLGNHPQGRLLLPLISNHDRQQFEIVCYCAAPREDHVTQAISRRVDLWRPTTGMNEAQVAQLVVQDRIDILVDLSLHAVAGHILTFAFKPAPIQVTYLGYCSTTGLDTIDYRLSDRFLDPSDRGDEYYSERTVRLTNSFWCYPMPPEAPPIGALPALANEFVTFGCLNDFAKVTSQQLELWSGVMRQIPRSRLILHAKEGSHRQRVLGQLARAGVAPDRVRFEGPVSLAQYFQLYNKIDIALDSFPYAGGTTTLDALWMGVPVISKSGDTAVSRAGLSILSNLGQPDLVAADDNGYVKIAVELARDPSRLGQLRLSLREQMRISPLMDATRFVRDLEAAFRQMWVQWCNRG